MVKLIQTNFYARRKQYSMTLSDRSWEAKEQNVLINIVAIRGERLVARGNFDRQHLMNIHAFIFEPFRGDDRYLPGEVRKEVAEGQVWGKTRNADEGYSAYNVYYSKMDKAAHDRLDTILEKMRPENLRKIDDETLATELSHNYAELDYIHPFKEGNSRTLREFFAQCTEEIGYVLTLDHAREYSREELYAARDKAVLEKVYPDTTSEKRKREINDTLSNKLDLAGSLEGFFKDNLHAMDLYERADFRGSLKHCAEREADPRTKALLKDKLDFFNRCCERDRDSERGLSR